MTSKLYCEYGVIDLYPSFVTCGLCLSVVHLPSELLRDTLCIFNDLSCPIVGNDRSVFFHRKTHQSRHLVERPLRSETNAFAGTPK